MKSLRSQLALTSYGIISGPIGSAIRPQAVLIAPYLDVTEENQTRIVIPVDDRAVLR